MQLVAAMVLGVTGSYYFMLAPVLVAGLVEHGYPDTIAGYVGSAPLAGMFVGSLGTATMLGRVRWRKMAAVAITCLIVGNLASIALLDTPALVATCQFLAGVGGATLLSIALALIGQTPAPDRLLALFMASQMTAGALGVPTLEGVVAHFGAGGLFAAFTAVTLGAAPFIIGLPTGAAAASREHRQASICIASFLRPGAAMALLTQVAFGAGIMLLWGSAARIGAARGIESAQVAHFLSVALLASILGALCASAIGRRIPVPALLSIGTAIVIIASGVVVGVPGPIAFAVGVALFGFAWNFLPPYQFGIAAELDRTGRLIVLNIALVKLGYASGAAAGGIAASSRWHYAANAGASIICFMIALIAARISWRFAHPR